ncbi:MAG: histidinol-phosphate transaminase [Clostridiaceae bacterium]|nr:histidinol-phosphate transaminase [Clostridiaceae bacterium]
MMTPEDPNTQIKQNAETAPDSSATRLWNKRTARLVPYVPGEQPRGQTFIKLNTNENPYPPSPEVLNALSNFNYEQVRLYPDPTGLSLRQAIAAYYGLTIDQIFAGNGSDEVLAMAFQAFFETVDGPAKPEQEIVFPDITYSFYPVYARLYDIPYRLVRLGDDFTLPVADCLAPSAGLVLANPNAPTGRAIDIAQIAELAAADRNRLILIDEAYIDFGGESAVALLPDFDNILIIQTCSKSRALAGMRLGYALGAPALIEALRRVRDSFNSYTLDSLAQAAGAAAFGAAEWFERTRSLIIQTREKTARALRDLGFVVIPSSANFLFVSHPKISGADLYSRLRQAGILVRHFNQPRIKDYLRITVGSDENMAELIRVLQRLLV